MSPSSTGPLPPGLTSSPACKTLVPCLDSLSFSHSRLGLLAFPLLLSKNAHASFRCEWTSKVAIPPSPSAKSTPAHYKSMNGMTVRQELYYFGMVPIIGTSHARSLYYERGCLSPSARSGSRHKSMRSMREGCWKAGFAGPQFLLDVSFNNSLARDDNLQISHNSINCANGEASVLGRRKLMELCIFSGLFTALRFEPSGAGALESSGVRVEPPQVGLDNGRVRSCEGSAPCVSTSSFRSPSRFMPPW